MHLFRQAVCQHLKTHSREKLYNCNQCNFASVLAGILRRRLKTHSGKKSFKFKQCDFASVHSDDLRTHLKLTLQKSCTNATMHLFWQSIWEDIWKLNLEKNRSNATNVTCICSFRRFEKTLENSHWKKSLKWNQCDYASVLAGNVRRHLKTHSGEKSFICNQRDFAYVHSDDLRKHLKLILE